MLNAAIKSSSNSNADLLQSSCLQTSSMRMTNMVLVPYQGWKVDWKRSRMKMSSKKVWSCSTIALSATLPRSIRFKTSRYLEKTIGSSALFISFFSFSLVYFHPILSQMSLCFIKSTWTALLTLNSALYLKWTQTASLKMLHTYLSHLYHALPSKYQKDSLHTSSRNLLI